MIIKRSFEYVRIVMDLVDDGKYRWQRAAGNHRVTHTSEKSFAQMHHAVAAAVRENPDIYREHFYDYTSGKRASLRQSYKALDKATSVRVLFTIPG